MKPSERIWGIAKARTTRDFPESMMCAVTVADVLDYLDERGGGAVEAETLTADELDMLVESVKHTKVEMLCTRPAYNHPILRRKPRPSGRGGAGAVALSTPCVTLKLSPRRCDTTGDMVRITGHIESATERC